MALGGMDEPFFKHLIRVMDQPFPIPFQPAGGWLTLAHHTERPSGEQVTPRAKGWVGESKGVGGDSPCMTQASAVVKVV